MSSDKTTTGPTTGPYSIEYHAYPCSKNGHGEPNPPAAFISPPSSDEAIALVFGQGDDPFDSPSQRANAHLFATSWDFWSACTPERLNAMDRLIVFLSASATDEIVRAAMLSDCRALLAALRAAVGRVSGEGGVASLPLTLCDGCNVRHPWEHRCHGGDCSCTECKGSEEAGE